KLLTTYHSPLLTPTHDMDDDALKTLLKHADAMTGAPSRTVSADDLLAAASRCRRRASYARTTAASLALVAVAMGALWSVRSAFDGGPDCINCTKEMGLATVDPATLEGVHKTAHHEDLASLEREAQMREQVVRAVLADEKTNNSAIETQTT